MANIIIISGPQAVGKMTVAEKLKEKIKHINDFIKGLNNDR